MTRLLPFFVLVISAVLGGCLWYAHTNRDDESDGKMYRYMLRTFVIGVIGLGIAGLAWLGTTFIGLAD